MTFIIIIILVIGGFIYFRGISEPAHIKKMIQGRPKEQQDVIKYFYGKASFPSEGFLTKRITDEEYDNIVASNIKHSNFKQKALDKIGLDESQVNEIEPVNFQGWMYGKNVDYAKYGLDNKPRTSAFQITWLFFSSSQVYVYRQSIHFNKDDKKVATEEYFYKDITSFSTFTDTVEQSFWNNNLKSYEVKNVDSNDFAITVPGDKFYCSMEQNDYTERVIQGMKAKLREKKG
jgi:hypothetical protein